MFRIPVLALLLLTISSCEGRQQALSHAGPNAVYAAERTDSLPVTTRRIWSGPGVQLLVSVTPDGTRIVFTDPRSGSIAVRDLATGAVQLLTHDGGGSYGLIPRVSPDGKRVAFQWWDNAKRSFRLVVAALDGSESKVIHESASTTDINPEDWSPDGNSVLALRSTDDRTRQIIIVPLDGTPVRTVRTLDWRAPRRMVFSPDGQFIAYDLPVDDRTGQRDVFMIDTRTGRETVLASGAADDYLLGWAPSGEYVLFMSDRSGTPGAWKIALSGGRPRGEPQLVQPDLWRTLPVGFTRDGSYWYGVLTSNRDVYVSSLDASGKPIGKPSAVMHQALGSAEFPVWSRDGQYLAYIVQTPPALDAQAVALPGARTAIGIRVAATGAVRELPLPVSLEYPRPQWAADGSALIVLVREKGRSSFYRVDIQSGTTALLFRPSGFVTEFQVNPEGKSITYKEARASADGAETRAIVARDLVSGTERELYSRAPADGAFWALSVSPDGAALAFAQGKDIVLLPTAGGQPRILSNIPVSQPGGISWSGDGRSLYVAVALSGETSPGEPTHEIMRVSIADGRAEKLNVAGEGLTRLSVDRGGRWMAYVAGRPRGEIWKMERIPVGRSALRESSR